MTCIAACVGRRGRVYLAADSLAVEDGAPAAYSATPKAWRWGDAVIGMAGDWSAICKARRMPEFRTLDDAGRIWTEAVGSKDDTDNCALVGWRGAIYYFAATGDQLRYSDRIGAIGSGGLVAIGVLASSQLGPEARVKEAVRVASRYVPSVGGQIVTVASD